MHRAKKRYRSFHGSQNKQNVSGKQQLNVSFLKNTSSTFGYLSVVIFCQRSALNVAAAEPLQLHLNTESMGNPSRPEVPNAWQPGPAQ